MGIEKILIVDDEILLRRFLSETLTRKKFDITTAENGQVAVSLLKKNTYDLVITDMKMPGMTGIEVLKKVKELSPKTLVIVITAFGSIENAVEAMRIGAFHYLIKPFTPDAIEAAIEKAQEHLSLVEENNYLKEELQKSTNRHSNQIIGSSAIMNKILDQVKRVAKSNASIFINGESGTGKEVIAQAIHNYSLRKNNPFIRVNCAAVPESLIESEFFGHEKGAFTGANLKRIGRFELAHKGTLLLDEITEIPIGLQAKLLRVIQEQELERVGGSKLVTVDVRFVSTSNRIMKEAIQENIFREDLYYRLNVVPIQLPPLRERKEDIPLLADHFLENICKENHKSLKKLSKAAEKKLLEYPWPGNIRELANIIERAVVMDFSNTIESEHLYLEDSASCFSNIKEKQEDDNNSNKELSSEHLPEGVTLQELEKRMIIETLEKECQNRTKTAKKLGISIRTLRNKLNEYQTCKAKN